MVEIETEGGLQAPHVIPLRNEYLMFYGDWEHIAMAKGVDGIAVMVKADDASVRESLGKVRVFRRPYSDVDDQVPFLRSAGHPQHPCSRSVDEEEAWIADVVHP